MKTKPFNLKEALAGKPCHMRDGRRVTELHLFSTVEKNPTLVVHLKDDDSFIFYHKLSGVEDDLVMLIEPVTKWINIFKTNSSRYMAQSELFDSLDEAIKCGSEYYLNYIGTFPIIIEE